MSFKEAVNATFFIIMVAILFLDAMVISKYETDLKQRFIDQDNARNLAEIKTMFVGHVNSNWPSSVDQTKDKLKSALDWSKGNWSVAAFTNYLEKKEGCVCMSLQLGI